MPSFDLAAKLALISAVIFIVVGFAPTYDATRGIFGGIVKQSDNTYGMGNTFNNRGFIVHALVFAVIMYLIIKYGLKL